jgi:uncharacterized protein YbgA (DUF1722 family)
MGGDEFSQKYLEKLEQDIDHAFDEFKAVNKLKTVKGYIICTVEVAVKAAFKGFIYASLTGAKYSTVPIALGMLYLYRGVRGVIKEDVSGNF